MSSTALPPHLDPRGRHRGGRPNGLHAIRPIGRVIGSILSITLLVVAGYAWYQFRALDKGVSRLSGVQVGANPTATARDIDGTDQNILIVGNDDRSNMTDAEVKELHVGRDGGSLATDTMMIVHIPANGARATIISLPRDTFVDIPDGYRKNLLNSPYASAYVDAKSAGKTDDQARTAGANLLIKTVTNLTGLTINHYVQIDLLGFFRLSNAIGGVPVDMCAAVNDTGAANRAKGEDGGSGLVLSKGKHVIEGLQALEFVRQRHGLQGGDLSRVKRQQYFLTSAFRQVASVGILFKLNQLGDALKTSVYFDGSLDLLGLARQLENLTANNIVGRTIPTSPDADGHLSADPAKVKAFVASVINGTDAAAKTSTPSSTAPTSSSSAPASTAAPAPSSTKTAIDSKCIY